MKKMKKLLIAVLLLALAAGAVVAVQHKRAAVAARPAAGISPIGVDSLRLAPGTVVLTLPVSAEVQALRDAVLASRASAYVAELTRFEGDRFRKGEVLVRLDMSQAESERLRAEAALAQSRLQQGTVAADLAAAESLVKTETERVARLVELHEIGGAALEQVQAAEAALAAAHARASSARANAEAYQWLLRASEAQARAARENLRYSVITAPFDGVVSQRLAQPGDLAAPGRPLLKVVDSAAGSRLLVSVPQGLKPVALLVAGQRLPLAPWPEAAGAGMARFEARAPARLGLLPGARVDARLEVYRREAGLLVPRACLLGDDGRTARLLRFAAGKVAVAQAAIAAQGEEGVALAEDSLAGATLLCASPDILTRVQAGAPVRVKTAPHPGPLPPAGAGEKG